MPANVLLSISTFLLFLSLSCTKEEMPAGDKCDLHIIHPSIDAKMDIYFIVHTTDGDPVINNPIKVVVDKRPCSYQPTITATETYTGLTDTNGYFYTQCNSMEVRNELDDFIITTTLTERDISKETLTYFNKWYDGQPKQIIVKFYVPPE